jgi:RNA-binding protein
MLELPPEARRALRARAHALKPVVMIADSGLTDVVLKEIDRSLAAHELIKIRVFSDDRGLRESQLATICDRLSAAPVQHIGKLLVVWRPAEAEPGSPTRRRKPPRRSKRSFQGSDKR